MASMGPRSCERGNLPKPGGSWEPGPLQWGRARASAEITLRMMHLLNYLFLLQWGRARASAEMPRLASPSSDSSRCFNGAALVRARKSRPGVSVIDGVVRASMGPRSCERGNEANAGVLLTIGGASMGPRSCERGNRRTARLEPAPLVARFNGAALVRARKSPPR